MAKKEKKKLTTKQEQTKYRTLQFAAIGGMVLSVITPFAIMAGVNFQEWFVNNSQGWKIGVGAGLGMAVAGIAVFLVAYKKEKELKVTEGWITALVLWFAAAFIVKLFEQIYSELFWLMIWTGVGLGSAFGFDIISKQEKKKADAYKAAREKVKEESIEERAKREVEEELKAKEEDQVAVD